MHELTKIKILKLKVIKFENIIIEKKLQKNKDIEKN